MQRNSGAVRTLWLLGAALQLALPGAAAYADARLDALGAAARPHIESHTTKSCTRIHPPDCALCHNLSAPLARRQPMVLLALGATGDRILFPAAPVRLAGAGSRPHPQPRAPPTLF
jgi:hypothetical protein